MEKKEAIAVPFLMKAALRLFPVSPTGGLAQVIIMTWASGLLQGWGTLVQSLTENHIGT